MQAPESHLIHHRRGALLSPRAAFRRVFGGMAIFVSFPLLGFGAYLINDQFEDPVGSEPGGLLCAAVLIATALVLLSYVIYPGRTHRSPADSAEVQEMQRDERIIDISVSPPAAVQKEAPDLAAHNRHVDTAKIRP